ncbi:TPA: hypothetical protein NPP35_001259 [Klebsiella variicola subsp. variicola]|nr:hypothetical protein [Klebsiella variicola subsp. variicola]
MKKNEDTTVFPRRYELATAPMKRGAKALSKDASEKRIKDFNDAMFKSESHVRIKK